MTNNVLKKRKLAERRKIRVRAKIHGTAEMPRLSVNRSLRYISAQLIDDNAGHTLVAVCEKELDEKKREGKPIEVAAALGKLLADKAKKVGVAKVVFDRGSYKYHGRVRAFADAAREAGLEF